MQGNVFLFWYLKQTVLVLVLLSAQKTISQKKKHIFTKKTQYNQKTNFNQKFHQNMFSLKSPIHTKKHTTF